MTGEPVRDLGYAAWYDPDAWLVNMRGARLFSVLREEKQRVDIFAKNIETNSVFDYTPSPHYFSGSLKISQVDSMNYCWSWEDGIYYGRDVTSNKKGVWFTHDIGHGKEEYQLDYKPVGEKKSSWTIKSVGPKIAVRDAHCYFLGVENKLWYNELWSCDAETGQNKLLIYKETNPEVIVDIVLGLDKKIYMTLEHSQDLRWYIVEKDKIKEIGEPKKTWADLKIHKDRGSSVLKHGTKKLIEIPSGKITIDQWAIFENRERASILVQRPHKTDTWFTYSKKTEELTVLEKGKKSGLELLEGLAKNTRYVLVLKEGLEKPKNVLITGYGAYGLPTSTQYARIRWNSLLEKDWAIAYTFLPGGGDHTNAYAKEARRDGRTKTIDCFLDCVKDIKKIFNLQAHNLVIYGRSAGGLLIGNSLAKHPDGLFGGIFTEVPYLDELRTTTNTELPLTRLEYKEFGDPAHNLRDFLSIGLMSPAESAVDLKTPNVFVYAKTATNDSQVYTYESVKWIRRLRKASPTGAPKLLKVDFGIGHFTPPNSAAQTHAHDCAILLRLTDQADKKYIAQV
jgi:protease II